MLKLLLYLLLALLGALLLFALVAVISAWLVRPDREYPRESRYYRLLINIIAWFALFFSRVRLTATGLEKLPEGRFLLVSNHRSKFDPIVTWRALKGRSIGFISKPENFSVPIIGRIIRRCCCLPIDRENPRKALPTILKAADLIRNDEVSVGVYPEGTRSLSGELLPFHNGVFKIAQKSGAPVVVAALRGTSLVHRNFPWKSTPVSVDILEVIPPETVKSLRTAELGQLVYNMLERYLSEEKDT